MPSAAHPSPGAGAGAPPSPAEPACADLVMDLILSRRSVAPKRLLAPGPSDSELQRLVDAAATAPDHRGLAPWRLVRVLDHQREPLAQLFEACASDRDPAPDAQQLAQARAKAFRAPSLLLAVLKTLPEEAEVPPTERAVALGAALMVLLLAAHGMGYAGMLTSGRAVRTMRFAQAFALGPGEQAVCFVSLGTAATRPPAAARNAEAADAAGPRLGDWAGPARINPEPGA